MKFPVAAELILRPAPRIIPRPRPFSSAGEHTVRIVQSWEKPSTFWRASNSTDVNPCDKGDVAQTITFDAQTGQLKDANGLCIDGSCAKPSAGCAPLKFIPCVPGDEAQRWTHAPGAQFVNAATKACMDLWNSGGGPSVGVYKCSSAPNQRWAATAQGFRSNDTARGVRCLSNGVGGGHKMTVQVSAHEGETAETAESGWE